MKKVFIVVAEVMARVIDFVFGSRLFATMKANITIKMIEEAIKQNIRANAQTQVLIENNNKEIVVVENKMHNATKSLADLKGQIKDKENPDERIAKEIISTYKRIKSYEMNIESLKTANIQLENNVDFLGNEHIKLTEGLSKIKADLSVFKAYGSKQYNKNLMKSIKNFNSCLRVETKVQEITEIDNDTDFMPTNKQILNEVLGTK